MPQDYQPVTPDCPIACLQLAPRTCGALTRLKIAIVAELFAHIDKAEDKDPGNIRYTGKSAAKDIIQALTDADIPIIPGHHHRTRPTHQPPQTTPQ